MTGFQNGSIRLKEVPLVYYAGQTINGSVDFDLREPLVFSVLYIQYIGEANVLWTYTQTDTVDDEERRRLVKYQGREEYFNYTESLSGGYGTTQLPQSHHSFSFKYQIPFTAPSSFKGKKGGVSYKIVSTMVYPDTRREVLEKEFTVVAPLDLNTGNPALKDPVDLELEELNPCSWCFDNGIISVRARLPVTGYCPGQTIPIAIEVQNESNIEITGMVFELTTKELYRSTQPRSEHVVPDRTLASVRRGAILANTKKSFTCDLVVPDMIVPYLEHCNIIDIGYFFKATVSLSGCNDDIQEESEICLGLVPLKETLTGQYVHPKAESLPSGPIPINDGTTASGGPVHNGSQNTTQSQPNLNRSANFEDQPPPYPGSVPNPTDNKFRNSTGDIGFRMPNIPFLEGDQSIFNQIPNLIANFMPEAGKPLSGNVITSEESFVDSSGGRHIKVRHQIIRRIEQDNSTNNATYTPSAPSAPTAPSAPSAPTAPSAPPADK